MQTWLDWLSDPKLPTGTLVTWLLLAALWAAAGDIGSVTALLAAGCIVVIARLMPDPWLRPLVPVSIAVCAGAILATEAWMVGLLVLVVLPVVASGLATINDRRLTSANG